MKKTISKSPEETEAFAAELAASLKPGSVLALYGDLGSGKTVFSRGFARGLGVTEAVTSPTFTIVQEYKLEKGGMLYHLDLYRISDSNAALVFGIEEFLGDPKAFALLEWPERIADILPRDTIKVTISPVDESTREISIA